MVDRVRAAFSPPSLLALIALVAWSVSGRSQTLEPLSLRPTIVEPTLQCGTTASGLTGAPLDALVGGLADGEMTAFDQDPPIVFPDQSGPITLRNFGVVGDFATVQFTRDDPDLPDGRLETWRRVSSKSVDGQLISLFEPSWPDTELASTLQHRILGFDRPRIYWGAFHVPGTTVLRSIYLRMGFAGIPASKVTQINDRVQYASNVVNLVVPGFGDARVSAGSRAFELTSASRFFYQYFGDAYDVLAVTPQANFAADYGAFHRNVRNTVAGLNINLFDQSSSYGSTGVLQSVELYPNAAAVRYDDTNHEMAHQWASNFDWTRIAGIVRAGWDPAAHSPLWTSGETPIGAVLFGDRRVRSAGSGYQIEATPAPVRYHPLEQYAMGLIDANQVADFSIFVDQGQFDPDLSVSPAAGTIVTGDTRRVSIADVIREHGARRGPALHDWRRATLLISRDRLASSREMDYWNFLAERLGDRNQASRPAYTGYGSFRRATGDAATLSTAIRPLTQPSLPEEHEIDTPAFGSTDWRGVQFSGPVPGRFIAGQTTTLSGRITALDPVDFNLIQMSFWKGDGSDPVRFSANVSRSKDFTITLRFTESQRGLYYLGVTLFWPGSGSQYSRSYLSTITVE